MARQTLDDKLDSTVQLISVRLAKKLADDKEFLRDFFIGFAVLFATELVLTYARAAIFMYRNKFWDYEYLSQISALTIPSLVYFLLAIILGFSLFYFAVLITYDKDLHIDQSDYSITIKRSFDSSITISLAIFLWIVGMFLVLGLAFFSEPLVAVEIILLSTAYFVRFFAKSRRAGIFLSLIVCFILVITVIASSFNSSKSYSLLLSNTKISDWKVSVRSASSDQVSSGCLVLLAPETIWLNVQNKKSTELTALSRKLHQITFHERGCAI